MGTVIFWHWGRTGGRSILTSVRSLLGKQCAYVMHPKKEELERLCKTNRFVQVEGCFWDIPGAQNVSVFRDPLSQILSWFGYVRSKENWIGTNTREAADKGVENFLNWYNAVRSNWQTCYLAGEPSYVSFARFTSDASIRERAFSNLSKMSFVGITEDIPSFLTELGPLLDVELPIKHTNQSEHPRIEEIDSNLVRKTLLCNEADTLLYETVREMCAE